MTYMCHIALTLCFTITTLLGPEVCCCSFSSTQRPATPTADRQQTPITKRVKSCCQQEVPPCGDNGKPNPEPGKPSKCPCEHDKPVKTLAANGTTTADLAAQLKLLDVLCVWLLTSFTFESPAITASAADTSPPVPKLAGRDLLAAYSLLRC